MGIESHLAPYAAQSAQSRGRDYPESSPGYRSEYQRDRDRVIHSAAFRRLVYKTQVFVNHEGDFYRNRLTHSVEVAQIGRTIARALRLNEDLVEAICLAHDLGHTPFGHAGQDALNGCMRDYGGFEHNLQSLRVVTLLEQKYASFSGLNLTFETKEGILKHCALKNARELGDLGERFIQRTQPGLEAQLANLADEIAYNNHDVDDGIRSELVTIEEMREVPLFNQHYEYVVDKHPSVTGRPLIHETVRHMINEVVTDVVTQSQINIDGHSPESIADIRALNQPLVRFSDPVYKKHIDLKRFLNQRLYKHERVKAMTDNARKTVVGLFESFFSEPQTLPEQYQKILGKTDQSDQAKARVVADYIAGMTDRFALSEFERCTG